MDGFIFFLFGFFVDNLVIVYLVVFFFVGLIGVF